MLIQLLFLSALLLSTHHPQTFALSFKNGHHHEGNPVRERISLNTDWRFRRFESNTDNLVYDIRFDHANITGLQILKPWILPTANEFIKDDGKHHARPSDPSPGDDVPYVQVSYDDSTWEPVTLPHDWAIKGPFYVGDNVPVGGGMGRLPSQGVGWYRRNLAVTSEDVAKGKSLFLDVDGAMSYAMVWVNGHLVGGWPYGYNSFRLDIQPFLRSGDKNQLAVRLDNPANSSRWYPGGGIYRNMWLTKVNEIHVPHWGTYITSRDVSSKSATVDLVVAVENRGQGGQRVHINTDVHILDSKMGEPGPVIAKFSKAEINLPAGQKQTVNRSISLTDPRLWGPWNSQKPNLYVAISRVLINNELVDEYKTEFGIRSVVFDANKGLLVNGQHVRIQGVNQHHDLGALGAAFNYRAAQRQLETLQELGCNAIRMSHNPPAPELLELTDRMGFLVIDEIFDSWLREKTVNDFHLIFAEWSEPDLRTFLRRDRNHPSVIAWSVGNEVGEQYTAEAGAAVAATLRNIVREEDPTRPVTGSMNYAKADMPLPREFDIINLNYQGEGIRDSPAYAGLEGIKTPPLYPDFHKAFPEKLILSSETAAAVSSRGTYIFPVTNETSAPVGDASGSGGDSKSRHVSAYELYTAPFGSSADKVFATQDKHPYVAGEFVWSGWDYLGEPTPYYSSRSSYFGIIDLAGFKKDRYHLYQARWRPDLKTAHILPHWAWPERIGQVTPVHVFTAADEAELWVNGRSQGRLKRIDSSTYRFRWDRVVYEPGELLVVTYKDGAEWANATVRTAGAAAGLRLTPDRSIIRGDGEDLSFVKVEIVDKHGYLVPRANTTVVFSLEGPGEIAATDNGDPSDMTSFGFRERRTFNGLALAIVRGRPGASGTVTLKATAVGLTAAHVSWKLQGVR